MRCVSVLLLTTLTLTCALGTPASSRNLTELKHEVYSARSSFDADMLLTDSIIDPYIEWPVGYAVHQTGMVNASFNCSGGIGTPWNAGSWNLPWPYASFESPPGSLHEHLWMGGLWIGGIVAGDTMVTTAMDGWSCEGAEFAAPQVPPGSITRLEYAADFSMRAFYTDTTAYNDGCSVPPHNPLNLQIINRSHVWRNETYEDIVIWDLTLTNIGDTPLEQVYVGLYMDTDIGRTDVNASYSDDLTGSLRDEGILYAIDNDGDPVDGMWDEEASSRKIFAVKLLASSHPVADTNYNWWVIYQRDLFSASFGPRQIGTAEDPFVDFGDGNTGVPDGDINKYYVLSHSEWDYDQIQTASIEPDDPVWLYPVQTIAENVTNGYDTRFLVSYGPFDLEPDSSIRLIFATFTADDVHMSTWNFLNLPDNPNGFNATLNFDDVLTNAARADELSELLLDPAMPVPNVVLRHQDWDSVVIEWDPWVFNNIEGYEIFLSEVPDDALPYPGLAPPWLRPSSLDPYASIGVQKSFTFTDLDPCRLYFVNVALRSPSGIGSEGVPVLVNQRERADGPEIAIDYTYFSDGQPSILNWLEVSEVDVDHYCVYKFEGEQSYEDRYLPFYSREIPEGVIPVDTFVVDDTTYYYLAMEPYAVIDSGTTTYEDASSLDGAYYVITAVDKGGFESELSSPISSRYRYEATRDILVISDVGNVTILYFDSVRAFYQSILDGYDFSIYSIKDTTLKYACDPARVAECVDWRDFTRFALVLFDLEGYDNLVSEYAESTMGRMDKFILTGTRFAYFGNLYGMNDYAYTGAEWHSQNDWFVQRFFGVDSLFFYHYRYYYFNDLPIDTDTCFGFIRAEPAVAGFPAIEADTVGQIVIDYALQFWQAETPPSVSTFHTTDSAEVIYRYRSAYPGQSWLEGEPVAVRMQTDAVDTYLFGFHLWHMYREQARELVDVLFEGLITEVPPEPKDDLPGSFRLKQNYPNPFNPSTIIEFDLPESAEVTLTIYNILGQRVKSLLSGRLLASGSHTIEWRGIDDSGQKVASGVYLYHLRAGNKTVSKKMLLVK